MARRGATWAGVVAAAVGALVAAGALRGCTSRPVDQPSPAVNTPEKPVDDTVTGLGTIVRLEIEGGFYAIHGDDGTTYDPKSLPEGFAVDGLRVRYRLKVDKGAAGIHMVGPIVEVIEITKE